MTGFDLLAVSLIGLLLVMGFWKGLAAQFFGLAGVVAGYILALRYYLKAAALLPDITPGTAKIVGFLIIFIGCIVSAYIIGRLLDKLMKLAGLGWANRLLGGLLGVVKGTLISAIIMVVLVAFLPSDSRILKESITIPYLVSVAKLFGATIPDDIKMKYKSRIELFDSLRKSGEKD